MKHETRFKSSDWALVLGASSGFGGASAMELARHGMNIFGVHLDRQATMPAVQQIIKEIKHCGREAIFYNMNAADAIKRNETLDDIQERFGRHSPNTVKVLLHSLAFGTLKPFIGAKLDEGLTQAQMEMTIDVMANSLVYWVQGLVARGLMKRGGRILGLTSSGGHSVLPAYGAVSAAKAALESHIRQLAMELGPLGITANALMAGVTNTPALRKIPGSGGHASDCPVEEPRWSADNAGRRGPCDHSVVRRWGVVDFGQCDRCGRGGRCGELRRTEGE